MKRCPKCSRTFPDDNQKFCTIDGGFLIAGESFDPNATISGSANLSLPTAPPPENPVSNRPQDFGETIAGSAPTAVLPRNKETGPTGAPTSANLPPTQPSAPLPPPPQQAAPPTRSGPLPQAPVPAAAAVVGAPRKKSKLPLILGILAILLILGVGAVAAAFFLVIKPQLDKRKAEGPVVVQPTQNENVNTNSNTNSNTETKPEPEKTVAEFVAPPDTTKFVNSSAKLDGKLAEHYFDFSFYYPNAWVADPKAGTAGSGNFVKVERRLPPDFTQENFAVRWYDSKGTFTADLPDFPAQVEQFSAELAKAFPEYHKVSEGPTKVNNLDAYEFRWAGLSKDTAKGDLQLWGRVVFLPTGVESDKTGAILSMFTTSLAPELSGVEDVGFKGQAPVILESFRFGH
jgi:hypothetical protein